jgi:hypothetical protein
MFALPQKVMPEVDGLPEEPLRGRGVKVQAPRRWRGVLAVRPQSHISG